MLRLCSKIICSQRGTVDDGPKLRYLEHSLSRHTVVVQCWCVEFSGLTSSFKRTSGICRQSCCCTSESRISAILSVSLSSLLLHGQAKRASPSPEISRKITTGLVLNWECPMMSSALLDSGSGFESIFFTTDSNYRTSLVLWYRPYICCCFSVEMLDNDLTL